MIPGYISEFIFKYRWYLTFASVCLAAIQFLIVLPRQFEFEWACDSNDSERVRTALQKYPERINEADSSGFTPLHWASWRGKVNTVKVLLEHRADPDYAYQCETDQSDIKGFTALHFAVSNGNLEIVKLLVQHRANIHAKCHAGLTPRDHAASSKQKDIVDFLDSIDPARKK